MCDFLYRPTLATTDVKALVQFQLRLKTAQIYRTQQVFSNVSQRRLPSASRQPKHQSFWSNWSAINAWTRCIRQCYTFVWSIVQCKWLNIHNDTNRLWLNATKQFIWHHSLLGNLLLLVGSIISLPNGIKSHSLTKNGKSSYKKSTYKKNYLCCIQIELVGVIFKV